MTKILVVEDEILIARDLQSSMQNMGYEVPEIAIAGEEALKKVAQIEPDLVLMDIHLKGDMDGIDAAAQIRARFSCPLIYLTAYADEPTLQRAKLTEPYGYLIKPFQERELKTTIEIALYKHDMEQKLQTAHSLLLQAHDRVERQVKELQGRDRLVRFQMSGPTLSEALEEILRVVQQVFEVGKAIVYQPAPSGNLEIAAAAGLSGPNVIVSGDQLGDKDLSDDGTDALATEVFRNSEPQIHVSAFAAAAPILYRDQALGVILVRDWGAAQPMDEEALQALCHLGEQSALLWRMARATEDLELGRIEVADLLELEAEED
jgi:CheY-like chemotaxis protein